jgi:mono/diheme cytochrome c family protein
MRIVLRVAATALLIFVLVGIVGIAYVRRTGLRSQPDPGALETRVARSVRSLAIPGSFRTMPNPLSNAQEAAEKGLEHFARYCAMCHGNDGRGQDGPFSRGLFPKPPDMRASATQEMTDGELFYIIENGVRFTGMPAFSDGKPNPAGEELAWQLVHFIRRLPKITEDELTRMKDMNPI